jgi:hypothetical protein
LSEYQCSPDNLEDARRSISKNIALCPELKGDVEFEIGRIPSRFSGTVGGSSRPDKLGHKNMIIIDGDRMSQPSSMMSRKNKQSILAEFHPPGSTTFEGIIDHEFGHQLNDKYGLDKDETINTLYAGLSAGNIKSGLSEYACMNQGEFVAESWTEYLNNQNPRPISRFIGNTIMDRIVSAREKK